MINKRKEKIEKVYNYIKYYINTFKYNPSYSQICEELGYSKGTVYSIIQYLVEHNYLAIPRWGIITLTEENYGKESI